VTADPREPRDLLAGTLHGPLRAVLRSIALNTVGPLLGLRIVNLEVVPKEGSLLVTSNHLSNADPLILEAVFPRPLFFMGKAELFQNWFFRWVLKKFGGFPVARGTPDLAALRHARTVLAHGIAVGVYPEGGRSKTGALVTGFPGAGLIALQARAPVLPVAIYGTEFFPVNGEWPPRRTPRSPRGVTIEFGQPYLIPDRVDGLRVTPEEATRLIMVRIAELLPEQYRGVYAADVNPDQPRDLPRSGGASS
jgi:1-acyl-sn-glycerol-3-phosphate acyltransferase